MSGFNSWPLQVAIYDILKADPLITTMVPIEKIASWIKDQTPPPYIMSGNSSSSQGVLDTKSQQGTDYSFEIVMVAQPSDISADEFIGTLQEHIYNALDGNDPILISGFLLEIRFENGSINDRGTNKKVGTMTFSAITSS